MKAVGIFEYTKDGDKRNLFQHTLNGKIFYFQVTRVNHQLAKICGSTSDGAEMPLAEGYTLEAKQGGPTRMTKGFFIITWFDSYILYFHGEEIFKLENERIQTKLVSENQNCIAISQ